MRQGIEILDGTKVSAVEKRDDGVIATLTGADGATRKIEAERLLSAAGVVANVEGLGLEALGVKIERGVIAVDGSGATNVAGIFSIGDVAGGPMLAHKAEHEGVACVEAIARKNAHPRAKTPMPACTYAHPQVASVGLTEADAKAAGFKSSKSAAFRSARMARRSRSASPRGWSRLFLTQKAAGFWEPILSAPRRRN